MIFAHANLGRGVSTEEFRRNMRRVLNAGGDRAVFAFQEIDEADAPEEMDYLTDLTRKTHRIVGGRTAVPILVPRHFGIEGELVTPASKGLAKFTPNRPITEAHIRIGPNLSPVILNGHMPIDRPQTQSRRADFRKALRSRANTNLEHGGLWVADTNTKRGWPRIAEGERIVTNAGIDKAKAWAPLGREVVVTDRRTIPLSIDGHDGYVARVRWVLK